MIEDKPIRVLIVDDHAVVRSGLAAFLMVFDDLQLVGEAAGGAKAIQLCQQVEVDVVLMDLVMPEMNGAEATYLIRQQCPNVQVIALTSFKEEDLIQGRCGRGLLAICLKTLRLMRWQTLSAPPTEANQHWLRKRLPLSFMLPRAPHRHNTI